MSKGTAEILQFDGLRSSLCLELRHDALLVPYWGERLPVSTGDRIARLRARTPAVGTPSVEPPITLAPTIASGFAGSPAIELHRAGLGWDFHPSRSAVLERTDSRLHVSFVDPVTDVELTMTLHWYAACDLLKVRHSLKNLNANGLTVNSCCAATLPLPGDCTWLTSFSGRWAGEFQRTTHVLPIGSFVRENLRGRTSHASFPGLLAHLPNTTEHNGAAYGVHLGWSGNHRLLAERLNDGRVLMQAGERLMPGEIMLGRDEAYTTPWLFASFSPDGFTPLSQNFHRFVRNELLKPAVREKPRPVHYNTWEALYFNHDIARLKALADKAASVGADRFVLDDGWFHGRRHDAAGLGDWHVDSDVYPDGLAPLIDHVNALGMEFGLWVEPEMVNPDSDLFRRHPDWVLSAGTVEQIPSRNQLVLDLGRRDVCDYLLGRLDQLLSENNIQYLKWDMNRDVHHPGSMGRPSARRQTRAVYGLISALREKHPHVEIESCSSGGARTDFGILEYTDRIWTSDSNDALDRQDIQRGMSFFFPSNVMGAHIGPRTCHITRRTHSMALRAATAFFGHMGMEMDLAELTPEEEKALVSAVALHKSHRTLLHEGRLVRLETADCAIAFGVLDGNSTEALFSYCQVATRNETSPEVLKLHGLDHETMYRLTIVWPLSDAEIDMKPLRKLDGDAFTGAELMAIGLQLPPMKPETALIIHLKASSAAEAAAR